MRDGLIVTVIFAIMAGAFIIFQIWTIIVAKRAREEIQGEETQEVVFNTA